jgi:hypothetical protein
MIWMRLLDSSPPAEVIDATRKAFDRVPHEDYRSLLARYVAIYIDAFEVLKTDDAGR